MMGELIVLYKSQDALHADWQQISADFDAARATLWREYELKKAVIDGDIEALAKVSESQAAVAKSEVSLLRAELGDAVADYRIQNQALAALRDSIFEFNDRCAAHKKLERRSARFAARLNGAA